MKKNFLFGLLGVLVAGFGFGGVSMAGCEGDISGDNEASLTIGETTHYCSLSEAIGEADGGTVKILKAKDEGYELPATIDNPMTIETDVEGVFIKHGSDQKITTVNADVTFKGITFRFSNDDKRYHFEQAANKTITMDTCVIDGSFHVWGDMNFKDCTFTKDKATSPSAYNLIINYGDVEFDGCRFTNNASRNVNIAWGGDDTYKVDFKNTTFTNNATDAKKAAVMVHELTFKSSNTQGYPYSEGFSYLDTTKWYKGETENMESRRYIPGKWTVTFDANTQVLDSTKYNSNLIGENTLYGVDDIYFEGANIVKEDATKSDYANRYGTLNGGDITVKIGGSTVYSTAKVTNQEIVKYNVTFDGANAVEVEHGEKVSKPTDPTKNCNKFDGWYVGNDKYDFNAVVTSDLPLISKWTYTCSSSSSSSGGGSGGGSSSSSKTTTTTDTKKAEETKTENKTSEEIELKGEVTEEQTSEKVDETATPDNGYSKEFNDAYSFAHKNGITTMDSIEKADMNAPLTRIAMAKMLSQYAINVLGRTPDTTKVVPVFPDVSAELDAAYNSGVTLAYQLGIMGINIDKFRPDDLVTRAEFGTALSRMLYATADGEKAYYETHLAKLMDEKIITVDTPDLQELRGYVMIMLMRSANK